MTVRLVVSALDEKPRLGTGQLLDALEHGRQRGPVERALILLSLATGNRDRRTLAATPIGERDAQLVLLRGVLFGAELPMLTTCPSCQERLESELHTSQLLAMMGGTAPRAEVLTIEAGGRALPVRFINSGDLLAVSEIEDANEAKLQLLALCAPEAPADAAEVVFGALAGADPGADVELGFTCSSCQASYALPFDIASFLWTELETWSERTLDEAHVLARAYGWTEDQIFALSPARRRAYLTRVLA